ncbi:MAG: hypothetical protein JXC85_06365 [Candidatus Aenigmarchaeota archaeon]|nr:hypothetical protein [Candidatus Aenigmarchaeota archaeon]
MVKMEKHALNVEYKKFGEITINGQVYYSDMTVYWNGKIAYRGKEHVIEFGEFMKILKSEPEIVVIGKGDEGVLKISEEVLQWAKGKSVDLYFERTAKAADIFNAFANQGKRVVGIFHVTC